MLKSGSVNCLEPYGPVQICIGTILLDDNEDNNDDYDDDDDNNNNNNLLKFRSIIVCSS